MTKAGDRSSSRGQMLPWLGLAASTLAVMLLAGGTRLLPDSPLVPGNAARLAATAGTSVFVPASAHATGANGSNWRTDVEVHNPGSTTASFTVQLLRRDANNSAPASKSYSLAARQSRRFADMLLTEFGLDGAAALRFVVASGSILVSSRTYNLLGQNPWGLPQGASFGQYVPGLDAAGAIGFGQEGRLIQLTQRPAGDLDGFRTNLGIVNATASALDVKIDFYRADGTWLGKREGGETNLPPYGFRQLDQAFSAWGTLADGYAVVKPLTAGGALFAFATVIDNHVSGDPVFIPAVRRTSGSTSPTPTPTRTPTATPTRTPAPTPSPTPSGGLPNLIVYKPSTWPACVVANYQSGCCTSSACCSPFLSTYYTTHIQFAVGNTGSTRVTAPMQFSLSIDGVVVGLANWSNPEGIEPGEGWLLSWPPFTDPVSEGMHTLTIRADSASAIAESNEADNSCGSSATWTSIVFFTGTSAASEVPAEDAITAVAPFRLEAGGRVPLVAAPGTVYVPASAHASGLNGANWRTDLEVHNPGSTAVGFQVTLLPQASDNGGTPPSRGFSLGPQQSVRYGDVLSSLFGYTGAAALRVEPAGGATLLVTSRTYNQIGPNSVGLPVGASFSQFVPGLDENASAIPYGEEGRLIQLTHRASSTLADFRTNIGYLNTTGSTIDLRIDLYAKDGTLLGTIQDDRTHLRPYESRQITEIFGAFASSLDDGYAVIRTTTPAGRFLAFATVIDNHITGDPIFVPAIRVSGSTSPTPTPTPTPSATTIPSGPNAIPGAEILNGAMAGLGNLGSGTASIADIANTGKLNGIDAALTQIANLSPSTTRKSGNGLVIDYGAGYKAKDGAVYKGSATITTSSFNVAGNRVTWTGVMTPNGLTKDGRALGSGSASWTIDYVADGSKVVGDASGSATSTSNPADSGSGSAHFDSSVCARYPVSGSITMTQGGKTTTAGFTNACDGSYTLSGTGLRYDTLDLQVKRCDGTYRSEHFRVALVETGGAILKDPVCGNRALSGFSNVRAWGTVTDTTVKLSFFGQIGTTVHSYGGTYQGTRSGPGQPFSGSASYTVVGACAVSYAASGPDVSLTSQPSSACNY